MKLVVLAQLAVGLHAMYWRINIYYLFCLISRSLPLFCLSLALSLCPLSPSLSHSFLSLSRYLTLFYISLSLSYFSLSLSL